MKKQLLATVFSLLLITAFAQDFMLQGFYWNYPRQSGILRWAQVLDSKVDGLSDAGFTMLWLPPLSRAAADYNSVGYDVMDYYDLGEYGGGATRFGTRNDVDGIINHCHSKGIYVVADMIYNHRAGGAPEANPSVEGWIENYTSVKVNAGDQPFPTDRVRYMLPIGGTTGNTEGTYYFKIRSASQHPNFFGKPYTIEMFTDKKALDPDTSSYTFEIEPNGGGDCAQGNNTYIIGNHILANVDNSGCGIDEYVVTLDTSNFNASGDTLIILLANTGANSLGQFSDHYIYGLWSGVANADIQSQVVFQTYTDYSHLNSGKGFMDKSNFKPNGAPTQLSGDIDALFFYNDIDHNIVSSQTALKDYSMFMTDTVGVDGIRVDAVKHFPNWFMGDVLDHLHYNGVNPKMVVGESYDFNPAVLNGWVNDVMNYMDQSTKDSIKVRVFDFALRGALKAACDQFGYDVRDVFNAGCVAAGASGYNVVTFVGNHDFRDPGQYVENNPELGYAYILTNNQLGVPCVFYPDYFSANKPKIDALMKAHRNYIFGANSTTKLTANGSSFNSFYQSGFANTTLCYQMSGSIAGKEVVVAINFAGDTLDLFQKINLANTAVGDTFTDIFNAGAQLIQQVNNNEELHIVIPPRSFAVFVEGDLRSDTISLFPTGIANLQQQELQAEVFPNPFSNEIYISLPEAHEVCAEIFDLSGRSIYAQNLAAAELHTLHPTLSAQGFYLLKVQSEGATKFVKLIRQ